MSGRLEIGELEVHTPLLEHDLVGNAYLAYQDTNPVRFAAGRLLPRRRPRLRGAR